MKYNSFFSPFYYLADFSRFHFTAFLLFYPNSLGFLRIVRQREILTRFWVCSA